MARARNTIRFDLVSKKIDINGGPLADASEGVLEVEACDWLLRKQHFAGLGAGVFSKDSALPVDRHKRALRVLNMTRPRHLI